MTWTWVDWAFAGVLVLSVLNGLARGFIREGLGFLAWGGALFAARFFAGPAGEVFQSYIASPEVRLAVGFVLVVFVVIVASGMIIRVLDSVVEWVGMGRFNRLLGGCVGFLKGGAIVILVASVVGLTPWRHAPAWQDSQLRPSVAKARDTVMQHWEDWAADRRADELDKQAPLDAGA
ncbi:CvpA family protein [Larsenimonas salina]|uniref:CvpA family protein n=1 Tax=Larsenimonas salina TaxID=1295565 RepID=UPI002073F6A0|nr:CvpA family protein [Larsenimonas salina]MCM5703539.1 CvpA family protein [Larsenimonas salina]